MSVINKRYLQDDYIQKNPTWDSEDSPWKAKQVSLILKKAQLEPELVCEVGCGAGKILEVLARYYPKSSFYGYDIAPSVKKFWVDILAPNVHLKVGDFFNDDSNHYDLILLLDVLEHVADPHAFLENTRSRCSHLVIHFPLDLSVSSVLREKPLLNVRRKVGHIHYFTKNIALDLLEECGYEVLDCQYTGACFTAPQMSLKTRLAQWPRRIVSLFNKDFGVRLLGGETLIVLAKPK